MFGKYLTKNLFPQLLLLAINYHRCHGIDENIGQSPVLTTAGFVYTANKHKVANISANFCKNLEWPQRNAQGPGEN